jgi:L-amino acid N-acyltransferase YncA
MTATTNSRSNIRRMVATDLRWTFEVRNCLMVRRCMFDKNEFTFDNHKRWFDAVSLDPTIELLIYETADMRSGFVQFKPTEFDGVFDWGFYLAPNALKGTGKKLGLAALDHIFKKKSCHKVCGQVIAENVASLKLHTSLGFKQEGIFRDHYIHEGVCHNVVHFGILKSDWTPTASSME